MPTSKRPNKSYANAKTTILRADNTMLDLTKDDLLRLKTHEQLRELVARLCKAELAKNNLPISAVDWPGSDTASDGGIDVEVQVEDHKFSGDFIPRAHTGIQVKTGDLKPSEIAEEMAPDGNVRPAISDIIAAKGAYLIVSLGDPARPSLAKKHAKMRQIANVGAEEDVEFRFYGRTKLLDWLHEHIDVQQWVRQEIELPLSGWKPFGRWAQTPANFDDTLITEDGVQIKMPDCTELKATVDGINAIRKLAQENTQPIRIIGHSGVGKTRIVQALFEEEVGECPLAKEQVIYADPADKPTPSPGNMLEQLIAKREKGILVLDNCPPDEHSRLVSKLTGAGGNLCLITIEHDVRIDQPENTDVVQITANGVDAVRELLLRRFPCIGLLGTNCVTAFAAGNARVALVLAGSFEQGKDISSLSDQELFKRIFNQRNQPNKDLHQAARVLSLVYSFSVETEKDDRRDLEILGSLINQDKDCMYSKVEELIERGVAQARGEYRAILPQAIANRLSEEALRHIRLPKLRKAFECTKSPQMLKSFALRLGYLHNNKIAQEIVQSWLSSDGILSNLEHLNKEQVLMLCYAAPIVPKAALESIENCIDKKDFICSIREDTYGVIVDILQEIAYEKEFFERCVKVLSAMAARRQGNLNDHTRVTISNLFSSRLSGTKAEPEFRSEIIRSYLNDNNFFKMEIGIEMLNAALKAKPRMRFRRFDFGGRIRDHGYTPRTGVDVSKWYEIYLDLFHESLSGATAERRAKLLELLAKRFRELWAISSCRKSLTNIVRTITRDGIWIEGWKAVRTTLYHDYHGNAKRSDPEDFRQLDHLSDHLEPKKIEDLIRTLLEWDIYYMPFPKENRNQELPPDSAVEEINSSEAERLGDRAASEGALDAVLSDAFKIPYRPASYTRPLGRGIARNQENYRTLWEKLTALMIKTGVDACHPEIMMGVLEVINKQDPGLAERLLDETVKNRKLRNFFIELQQVVSFNERSIVRLKKFLEYDDFQIGSFDNAWRQVFNSLSEEDFADLLSCIAAKPNGGVVVLRELSTRFENGSIPGPVIARVGLSTAVQVIKESKPGRYMLHYGLKEVLEICLFPKTYTRECEEVLGAMAERIRISSNYFQELDYGIQVIAERMPFELLDFLFKDLEPRIYEAFPERSYGSFNPLNYISIEDLISWTNKGDQQQRLQELALEIDPFGSPENDGTEIFTDQALALIENSKDPTGIIEAFYSNRKPYAWMGEFSDDITRRRTALAKLSEHPDKLIRSAVKDVLGKIDKWIGKEQEEERKRYETFE